ncbi:hypothetical protein FB451DRAFT_1190204 [Mycena latifolia]|nr:hypothetical protein FB451DRAFT_1190204 [Mycena latifolia]
MAYPWPRVSDPRELQFMDGQSAIDLKIIGEEEEFVVGTDHVRELPMFVNLDFDPIAHWNQIGTAGRAVSADTARPQKGWDRIVRIRLCLRGSSHRGKFTPFDSEREARGEKLGTKGTLFTVFVFQESVADGRVTKSGAGRISPEQGP